MVGQRWFSKLASVWREGGALGVARRLWRFIHWRVRGRKNLVLFEFMLNKPVQIYPCKGEINVRLLRPADMEQIRSTFFPLMDGDLQHDKECFLEFESVPNPNRRCFVAEMDGQIVHYSWVTTGVPRYGCVVIGSGVAYIGPCFTLPQARGLGIYPHVLTVILRSLQQEGFLKALIQAHKDNLPSIRGIEKAGFVRVVRK
jgi:GNAT superfamily N-acetyltransferase